MRLRKKRLFAAVSGCNLYEGETPASVAPWAAAADEPVFVRVEVFHGKSSRVKATVVHLRGEDDPTQYLQNVTEALENVLVRQFEENGA